MVEYEIILSLTQLTPWLNWLRVLGDNATDQNQGMNEWMMMRVREIIYYPVMSNI